jgi:hypothetical protein
VEKTFGQTEIVTSAWTAKDKDKSGEENPIGDKE